MPRSAKWGRLVARGLPVLGTIPSSGEGQSHRPLAHPAAFGGQWHESLYSVRALRLACRCAHCVEEGTGRPLLDETNVPLDVRPVQISPVGRYAIQFTWSDGHDTGIHTFEYLRSLCPCCAPC